MNAFIEILKKANEQKWCVKQFCTTCGSRQFRDELQKLGEELGGPLADALSELVPRELMEIENWEDALFIAIYDLPIRGFVVEDLLKNWLSKLNENIYFADVILYKIVKLLPNTNEMRKEWIEKCIKLALEKKHFSLTESLILVLGRDGLNYAPLIEQAKEFAKTSEQMKRVLLNACNLKI